MDPNTGRLEIAEVKEGEKNRKIEGMFDLLMDSRCPRALSMAIGGESKSTVDQLARYIRQAARMAHVMEIANTGKGKDPDSGEIIKIHPDELEVENYDPVLSLLMQKALDASWAIEVIDGCLFIGCYSGLMQRLGESAFRVWLEEGCHEKNARIVNLWQLSMADPLSLPIFTRNIATDLKFDLLFNRVSVYMCLHVDGFIQLAAKHGLRLRRCTKREIGRVSERAPQKAFGFPFLVEEKGREKNFLFDGVLGRIMGHGMTPRCALKAFARYGLGESGD
jgi:hypothetical protein